MGWRSIIGNLLERLDRPALVERNFADPFNFALHQAISTSASTLAIVDALQTAFPTLAPQQAEFTVLNAQKLSHQALLLYYAVRDGKLTEAEAETQIKAAYPTIDAAIFHRLRANCHIATSK